MLPYGKWASTPKVCDEVNLKACSALALRVRASFTATLHISSASAARPRGFLLFRFALLACLGDYAEHTSYTKDGFERSRPGAAPGPRSLSS